MEISTGQAAQLVPVSTETLRSWCERGLLKHRRVGLRGTYQIDVESLRKLANELGYRFNDEVAQALVP